MTKFFKKKPIDVKPLVQISSEYMKAERDILDICITQQTQIHCACKKVLSDNARIESENQRELNRSRCVVM